MKKIIILLILLLFILTYNYSLKTEYFDFYIPSQNEYEKFIDFYNVLKNYKKDFNIDDSGKTLTKLYNKYFKKNTINALFFQSFLLSTNNIEIKKCIKKYILKRSFYDDFSGSLLRLYSNVMIYDNDPDEMFAQRKSEEYKYDGFDFFSMKKMNYFNGEFEFWLFDNQWDYISFENNDEIGSSQKTYIYDRSGFSIEAKIKKISDINLDRFIAYEIDLKANKKAFINYDFWEVVRSGILQTANADRVFLCTASNEGDIIIILLFYSSKLKNGYTLAYRVKITKDNNNYNNIRSIMSLILLQMTFSKINS